MGGEGILNLRGKSIHCTCIPVNIKKLLIHVSVQYIQCM